MATPDRDLVPPAARADRVRGSQWIDPTSHELLDLIIECLEGWPVLLVATFRSEFQTPWTGQPIVTAMSLNRLNRRNAAMLVQGLVGAGPRLPNDVADAIVERCDGVPLFLEELTKAILEEAVEATEVPVSVPATLRASLLARLDRLGPDAKEVAQIGAAIGREFSFELLAAVAGQDLMRPEVAVNKLVEADLVFSTESFHRPAFCSSIRWCRRPPTTHYYARCVSFCTRGWPMRSFRPTVKK